MSNKKDLSERDICTQFILPALVKAGWNVEKQIREEALQKLIDAQLESDAQEKEEEYSIEDHANPMNAVLNR